MVWALNESHNDARNNCAILSAAALFSHVTGDETTSGAMMRRFWEELVHGTGNNEQSLNSLNDLEDAELAQSPYGLVSWAEARKKVKTQGSRQFDNFDGYRNLMANKHGCDLFRDEAPSGGLASAAGAITRINQLELNMVHKAALMAAEHAGLPAGLVTVEQSRTAEIAVQKIGQVLTSPDIGGLTKPDRGHCLFALHSRRLGHWLLGCARILQPSEKASDPWGKFLIKIVFADYQPVPGPLHGDLPFLGIAPTAGDGNDENDLVIFANRKPKGLGWPEWPHDGEVEAYFHALLNPDVNPAQHDGQDALDAETGADLDAALGAAV